MAIRVAVVDDHPLFRQGLAGVIEQDDDCELVLSAPSVAELDRARPECDLVLLDLGLPGLSGADAVRHLIAQGYRVLVISAAGTRADVVAAIGAGAAGFVSKDADPEEVATAMHKVAGGGTFVSPTLALYLLQSSTEGELSPREQEILQLVADGETDKDIAELLHISPATVASHLARIRDKTGKRKRSELTRYAVERGIVRGEG